MDMKLPQTGCPNANFSGNTFCDVALLKNGCSAIALPLKCKRLMFIMYTIYYEKHVGSRGISQCSHGVATPSCSRDIFGFLPMFVFFLHLLIPLLAYKVIKRMQQ